MTDTTPKRRGRPKGERPALTSAQRMERARERVRFALDDPEGDITTLPDNLLLEAVALAFRKDRPGSVYFGAKELLKRMNARGTGENDYVLHIELVPKADTVPIGVASENGKNRTLSRLQRP